MSSTTNQNAPNDRPVPIDPSVPTDSPVPTGQHLKSNGLLYGARNVTDVPPRNKYRTATVFPEGPKNGGDLTKVTTVPVKEEPLPVVDTKPKAKLSTFRRILHKWSDEESVLRLSTGVMLLILYAFLFAAIMYATERNAKSCQWTYWQALSFVNTVFTTIGYGKLIPCTVGGKVATIILGLIGIGLNVIALTNVGKLLARFLHTLWNLMKRCSKMSSKKARPTTPVADGKEVRHESAADVPLWVALVITTMWLLISAAFFAGTENSPAIGFGDSLYFVLISVMTIGFGDIAPQNYSLVLCQYFCIILGIALFSMVFNVINDKLDSLAFDVQDKILAKYAEAQNSGAILAGNDAAARREIKRLMKKEGGVFSFIMGKHAEDRLVDEYVGMANRRVIGTQTDTEYADKDVMAVVAVFEAGVEMRPELQEMEVQTEEQLNADTEVQTDPITDLHLPPLKHQPAVKRFRNLK